MRISKATSAADQGYAAHAAVFSNSESRSLIERIEAARLPRSRAGARHVLSCEPVRECANDPRLIEIASDWLGGLAIPFKATLFDKSIDANWLVAWHQDTALPLKSRADAQGWGPWSEKDGITYAHAPARVLSRIVALRVHLDDSNAANGPLKVLPATHESGVLTDEQVHALSRQVAPVECHSPAGGVIVMRPLIVHASSKITAAAPRRVLHIEYAESLEPEPGMKLRAA